MLTPLHGAVADIAEHVDATEPEQVFRHRSEALGEDVRAGEGHMIVEPAKREIDLFVLQKVGSKLVLLLADPCERQTGGQMDLCRKHLP